MFQKKRVLFFFCFTSCVRIEGLLFLFKENDDPSNFHISTHKHQFLPGLCVPFKVSPILCFETLKVAHLPKSLLIHTNDCPFYLVSVRKKRQTNNNNKQVLQGEWKRKKEDENRGSKNQLSWTSRPAFRWKEVGGGRRGGCVLTELPNYFGEKTRRTGTHML